MNQRTLLSETVLDELEARWRALGAPIAGALRPGLGESQLDRAAKELGLELPTEARTWWQWHDGTSTHTMDHGLGPGLLYLGLEDAVALCFELREQAAYVAKRTGLPDLGPDYWWPGSWFPVVKTGHGGYGACDCSVSAGGPTPIYYVKWGESEDQATPITDSFGDLVAWWVDALESGAWHYDPESRCWERHAELLPPDREPSGLV